MFNRSYLFNTIDVHIPFMLDNNQKELVKSSINRMNFLHFINGPLFEKMATSFLLSLGAGCLTGWALLGAFYPQHKKRYQQWCLVRDAIESMSWEI